MTSQNISQTSLSYCHKPLPLNIIHFYVKRNSIRNDIDRKNVSTFEFKSYFLPDSVHSFYVYSGTTASVVEKPTLTMLDSFLTNSPMSPYFFSFRFGNTTYNSIEMVNCTKTPISGRYSGSFGISLRRPTTHYRVQKNGGMTTEKWLLRL